MQIEIANAVAGALRAGPSESLQKKRARQADTEAYEAMLLGRHHSAQLLPESVEDAEHAFEKASLFDPDWAEPFASMAALHFHIASIGWRSTVEQLAAARAGASQALERDPSHAMAHAVMGAIRGVHDYDWGAAETHARTALSSGSLPIDRKSTRLNSSHRT